MHWNGGCRLSVLLSRLDLALRYQEVSGVGKAGAKQPTNDYYTLVGCLYDSYV